MYSEGGMVMKNRFKLFGIEMKYFIPIVIVLLLGMYLGKFPKGMLGAFPLMIVLGAILNYIGNKLPIVKDYLGGGPIVIIFASAALMYFKIIPDDLNSLIFVCSQSTWLHCVTGNGFSLLVLSQLSRTLQSGYLIHLLFSFNLLTFTFTLHRNLKI